MDIMSALGAIGAGLQIADERRRKKQLEDEERSYQKTLRERQALEWDRRQKEWARDDAVQPEMDEYNAALRKSKLRELQDAEAARVMKPFESYVKPYETTSDDRMTDTISIPSAAPVGVSNKILGIAGGPGIIPNMIGNIQVPAIQPFQGPARPSALANKLAEQEALSAAEMRGKQKEIEAGVRRGYVAGAPIPTPKTGKAGSGSGSSNGKGKSAAFSFSKLDPAAKQEFISLKNKFKVKIGAPEGYSEKDIEDLAEAQAAEELMKRQAARSQTAQPVGVPGAGQKVVDAIYGLYGKITNGGN